MSVNYHVSASPHIRSKVTTSSIMFYVMIALLPATVLGIYNFGFPALFTVLITMSSTVLTEYLYQKLMGKKMTIQDGSAALTGLLLALNLPAQIPWWICVLGAVFAILVVKQVFGGIGQNFMNPALGARCFLLISFTGRMTQFTYDGVTGATPLALLKQGEFMDLLDLFLGNKAGTIGETSIIAILIGAIFLLVMGIIDFRIPVTFMCSFLFFLILFSGHGFDLSYLISHLFGGGLMLGAWFMATDYVTSPITKNGKLIYGACLGILTGVFRLFGGSAEGVSYAIIFGNLLVPLIEKITIPKPFGMGGNHS